MSKVAANEYEVEASLAPYKESEKKKVKVTSGEELTVDLALRS